MTFDEFWKKSIDLLELKIDAAPDKRLILSNWRVDKDLSHEKFPVVRASESSIKCLSIYASKDINIPSEDMEELYGMWDDYLAGELNRLDIIDRIPRPAYCLAVMKYLKDSVS